MTDEIEMSEEDAVAAGLVIVDGDAPVDIDADAVVDTDDTALPHAIGLEEEVEEKELSDEEDFYKRYYQDKEEDYTH